MAENPTEIYDDFKAPQFFDFSNGLYAEHDDTISADDFFETTLQKHQNEIEHTIAPQEESISNDIFYSPPDSTESQFRRSISMVNLPLKHHTQTKDIEEVTGSIKNIKISRINSTTTYYNSTSNLSKLKLAISRDHLNKLAMPISKGTRFISLAEAVNKFQQATPTRFRNKISSQSQHNNFVCKSTIPKTPNLTTKTRVRPVHILNRAEQEMKEFEEAKKFQIKARPVGKFLKKPSKEMLIETKPPTKFSPFNLTEAHHAKKISIENKEVFTFHAKPVPKSLYEPNLLVLKNKQVTKAKTPNFIKRQKSVSESDETKKNNVVIKENWKPTRTKPMPFSFEIRDKNLIKKKEEFIKKVLEEEKKAREFHARPLPKTFKESKSSTSLASSNDPNNLTPGTSNENINKPANFKARPPIVLTKKPFEPKKTQKHLIEIHDFQLNTEKRAKERQEFEQKLKEKEKRAELIKQEVEEKLRQKEEEEIARLRKEAVIKAQPFKPVKEFTVAKSIKELTIPKTPKFTLKNKENIEK